MTGRELSRHLGRGRWSQVTTVSSFNSVLARASTRTHLQYPEIRYKEQGILPVKEEKQDQRTPSEEEKEPLRGKGKEREIVSVIHQGSNLGPSGC